MPTIVPWLLFSVALAGAVLAWVGLYLHWSAEHHRVAKVLANLLATAASLLACGGLAYVEFVRPIPPFDYTLERLGLLLSFSGILLGFVTSRFSTWYSNLAFGVSGWMFVLFLLQGLTS